MVNKLKRKYYKIRKSLKLKNSGKSLKLKNSRKSRKNQKGGASNGMTVCAPYIAEGGQIQDPAKKVVLIKPVDTDSCLTSTALNKLVEAWNKEVSNPQFKISASQSQNKIYRDMVSVFNQSNSRLVPEHKWWEQPWVKKHLSLNEIDEIKHKHYAPEAPDSWISNPTEWLSTLDIDAKLEQYEVKYPEFKYFGATPIDFSLKTSTGSCQVNSLCNINLKALLSLKVPKRYIGAVFNLDKHDEPGSHWIAMFVNIPKKEINYWDSYGIKPPQEVEELMNKLVQQGKECTPRIDFTKNINTRRHQYKGSECGVYSCNFIIQQLEKKSFKEVVNNIISDDEMNARRWKFFNK
jgi:hypothetical protein